jgi:hypothetical protein
MATQRPGDEQIRQRLDSSITGLDDQRTENLKRTQLLQTNKDKALKKEQARLGKKYGADHPRVAKITNRLDYNQAALPEMKTEIERSQIKIPEFDANTWMVQGRVLNQKLTGIKGLTLALYDANGKVEKRLGYACTDERGYYAIRYQVKEGQKPLFDPKTDYFLTVTDGKGKVCHKEEQPLHVVIGQTDYRLIVLGDTICTPPPGWDEGRDGGDDDDDDSQTDQWSVAGKVTYDDNKPGSSLIVHVFNKQEEKNITKANTSRSGVFKFVFTTEKFPDLFKNKPDLYLVISDRAGKELHITDKPLQPKIGGMEELKIVLKRK